MFEFGVQHWKPDILNIGFWLNPENPAEHENVRHGRRDQGV